jgi:DNA-binding transcriptional LysR family regulator
MDLRQITYFMRVYDAGSFNKASRQAHVAQPALSVQIARLEEELNVVLFERHANGVVPTIAGRRFYEICQRIVSDMSAAKAEMAAFSKSVSGRLRVGLPPSACRTVLGQFLPRFADDHPNVEIVIHEAFSGTLTQWVLDGTVDFAIASRPQNEEGLSYRLIHSEPVVLASNSPEFGGMLSPVDLRSVRSLKLIAPLPQHEVSRSVLQHLKDIGIRIDRIMYLDGYASTIEMLRNSDWATLTAWSVVYSELENESINVHPLVGTDLTYHLCLVHLPGTTLSPAAQKFVDMMQQAFIDYTARYTRATASFPG